MEISGIAGSSLFAGDGRDGVEGGNPLDGGGNGGGRFQFRKGGRVGWDASNEQTFVEIIDGLVEV